MLNNWGNFFFGSFDSAGLVMVDKPPVSFWVQAIPSVFLGVSEWSTTLPQVVLGMMAIILLYVGLRPVFGKTAARISALVLATIPASVVIDSGNEPDAFLSFTLLLAALAIIRAVETGKWRWLVVFGLLMGLGFNTKMLVAFIPLPVFLLYYVLASKYPLKQALLRATLVVEIIIVVSMSWITVVAFTPEDSRPYVGSTQDNSIWTLVFEYNGINRFTSFIGPRPRPTSNQPMTTPSFRDAQYAQNAGMGLPEGNYPQFIPPAIADESLDKGLLGLFYNPLAGQLGWLLPVGLFGLVFLIIPIIPESLYRNPTSLGRVIRTSPVAAQGFIWGGWLLIGVIVFGLANSTTTHPYYLVGVAVPLAATIGIAGSKAFEVFKKSGLLSWVLLFSIAMFAGYQIYGARDLTGDWVGALVFTLVSFSTIILIIGLGRKLHDAPLSKGALVLGACVLLLVPLVASSTTAGKMPGRPAFNPRTNLVGSPPPSDQVAERMGGLTRFLLEETDSGAKITLGGLNARSVSPFIVAGIPSISIGGFSGNDPIFTRDSFIKMALLDGPVYFLMQDQRMGQGRQSSRQSPILDYVIDDWTDISRSHRLPQGTLYRNPNW
ncbi:MAG: 4-amino-4-deoxy-L-arabinose transferase [Chloroflexi bacterium]|jgi:4-amino-4-deoxy-L-arabinose transferase-like glycosyltransferase|nr:MAG: 4-amino-4-deoxy-L-arabinose transferase [Chloroflexota bacterium]